MRETALAGAHLQRLSGQLGEEDPEALLDLWRDEPERGGRGTGRRGSERLWDEGCRGGGNETEERKGRKCQLYELIEVKGRTDYEGHDRGRKGRGRDGTNGDSVAGELVVGGESG